MQASDLPAVSSLQRHEWLRVCRATLLAGPSEKASNPEALMEESAKRAALFLIKFLLLLVMGIMFPGLIKMI
jgi:hypothetical protein